MSRVLPMSTTVCGSGKERKGGGGQLGREKGGAKTFNADLNLGKKK